MRLKIPSSQGPCMRRELNITWRDFSGSPVVKTLPSIAGVQSQSLSGELRFHMPLQPKNQNIKQQENYNKFNERVTVKVPVTQSCPTLATPWTVAHRAPLSTGFSRKNTGVGCHSLLQRIFPTHRSNLGLLHYRQIVYHLSHQGSPTSSIKTFKNGPH